MARGFGQAGSAAGPWGSNMHLRIQVFRRGSPMAVAAGQTTSPVLPSRLGILVTDVAIFDFIQVLSRQSQPTPLQPRLSQSRQLREDAQGQHPLPNHPMSTRPGQLHRGQTVRRVPGLDDQRCSRKRSSLSRPTETSRALLRAGRSSSCRTVVGRPETRPDLRSGRSVRAVSRLVIDPQCMSWGFRFQ
jgi:hypothetical protein